MMKKFFLLSVGLTGMLFVFSGLYQIEGTSMNYGLVEGDYVFASRYFRTIERGDMLAVRHPEDPHKRLYIKRCAAIPGDRFFQKARAFYLQIEGDSDKTGAFASMYDLDLVKTKSGYFLKEPYLKYYGVVHNWKLKVPTILEELPVTEVPKGHYYMLGDYRDNSADSRFFGAVPRAWIVSKIVAVFKRPRDWKYLLSIEEADREE